MPRRVWERDHWYEEAPEEEPVPDPAPPPGSRAAGADPHDAEGHAVDYAGQDCPGCRRRAADEMKGWW